MIHTVMPMEMIFPSPESAVSCREITTDGVYLLVEQLPDGRNRIERIISSNPMDFLNPRLQPGTVI
jgi:hypothetical protein